MVLEHQDEHDSQWAAIGSIAAKMGCTAETLRKWVRQAERDQGRRAEGAFFATASHALPRQVQKRADRADEPAVSGLGDVELGRHAPRASTSVESGKPNRDRPNCPHLSGVGGSRVEDFRTPTSPRSLRTG